MYLHESINSKKYALYYCIVAIHFILFLSYKFRYFNALFVTGNLITIYTLYFSFRRMVLYTQEYKLTVKVPASVYL